MTKADLYWLAGLLEGEGYFGGSPHRQLAIRLMMTDEDVVVRAAQLLGVADRVHLFSRRGGKYKDVYHFAIGGPKAAAWMMTLWPLLGHRRREQVSKALSWWKDRPLATDGTQTHCNRGHEFTEENTGIQKNRWRYCLACHRERRRNNLAKRKQSASRSDEKELTI